MKTCILFLVTLLCAIIASVQSVHATAQISGQVTAAGTNPPYPIAGVTLKLSRNGPPMTTTTDANGNYSFSGMSAGDYRLKLKVRHTLHLDYDKDIDLPPGGTVTVNMSIIPRLELTPLCSLAPSVTRSWNVHNPLPVPVNYTWLVVHHTNQTGSGVATPGDSTFDTPSVQHENLVRLFVSLIVVDQKKNHGDICPSGSLFGSVTDNTGASLSGVQVAIIDSNGNTVTTVSSQTAGSYLANNLLVGAYSLVFTNNAFQSKTVTGVMVTSGGNTPVPLVQLIPIAPSPMATVNVTVIETGNGGIANATVTIIYSNGTTNTQNTDGSGLAHFVNQPLNVAAVINVALNDGSLRTATSGSNGFVSGPNDVPISVAPVPKGSVSGRMTDFYTHNGLGGVSAAVIDPSNNATLAVGSSLADGTYSIGGIVVGTYSLVFTLSGYNSVTVSNVVVNDSANTVQNAILQPLVPPHDAIVTVTVINAGDGTPMSGASVMIAYNDGSTSETLITDGNGTVLFENQLVGVSATISIIASNGASSLTLTHPGGFAVGPNSVTAPLSPPPPPQHANVIVTVINAGDGTPMSLATVIITYHDGSTSESLMTDGSGTVLFENQLVGVSATITIIASDGASLQLTFSSGFTVGSNPVTGSL